MESTRSAAPARQQVRIARILRSDPPAMTIAVFLVLIGVLWWWMDSEPARHYPFAGIELALGAALVWRIWTFLSIRRNGVLITAKIMSRDWNTSLLGARYHDDEYRWRDGEDEPDYARVTVRYAFGGREYTGARGVRGRFTSEMEPGGDVQLVVDRTHPARFIFERLS